jgi:hypothetical protein
LDCCAILASTAGQSRPCCCGAIPGWHQKPFKYGLLWHPWKPGQGFWSRAFSFFSEPVATIYQLRSGHKEAALERTNDLLGGSAFIAVRVRRGVDVTKFNDPFCLERPARDGGSRISLYNPVMSWWLSPVTQRVLDAQLCDQENVNWLSLLLESLERKK